MENQGIGNVVKLTSSSLSSFFNTILYTGGTFFVGTLFLLYIYQNKLLYFPVIPGAPKRPEENPPGYRNPMDHDIQYEDLNILTDDKIKIHAWLLKQNNSKSSPTIIFFHGNAGNIGLRLPNAIELYKRTQCNLLLVDYRGYGNSEGQPSEVGLLLDAKAALIGLRKRPDIDPNQIFLFGRSLGGAVAVALAELHPEKVVGVILENTFLNISLMVDKLLPILKHFKKLVLRIEWDSSKKIRHLEHRILFIAGQKDELVPHFHMEKLFDLAIKSRDKYWYVVSDGSHNDTWLKGGPEYYHEIRKFIKNIKEDNDSRNCPEDFNKDIPKPKIGIPSMLEQSKIYSHS